MCDKFAREHVIVFGPIRMIVLLLPSYCYSVEDRPPVCESEVTFPCVDKLKDTENIPTNF